MTNFFDSVQTPDTIQPTGETPSISLSASAVTVEVGDHVTISAAVVPASATVTWEASGEHATVTDGRITGVSEGDSVVTATITVGEQDYSATCNVTVVAAQA